MKKAKKELDIMKLSDEDRRAYTRYHDDLHYQASMVESSCTVGMMKGKEEGRKEEKKTIALSLLESGLLDMQKIAETTGLTPEEVQALNPGTEK